MIQIQFCDSVHENRPPSELSTCWLAAVSFCFLAFHITLLEFQKFTLSKQASVYQNIHKAETPLSSLGICVSLASTNILSYRCTFFFLKLLLSGDPPGRMFRWECGVFTKCPQFTTFMGKLWKRTDKSVWAEKDPKIKAKRDKGCHQTSLGPFPVDL